MNVRTWISSAYSGSPLRSSIPPDTGLDRLHDAVDIVSKRRIASRLVTAVSHPPGDRGRTDPTVEMVLN
jgi:hypothetical protein